MSIHRFHDKICLECKTKLARANLSRQNKTHLCHKCFFNPKEEFCCDTITVKGIKCKRRKRQNENHCSYHFNLQKE